MSLKTVKRCPHCGHVYESYNAHTKQLYYHWGCPIRTCPSCKNSFLDKDIKEPALEPAPQKITVVNCLFRMFFPFGILAILFALPLTYDEAPSHFYYLLIIVPAAVWIVCAVYALIKRRKLNAELIEEYAESEDRLKDPEYASLLRRSGYDVPDRYPSVYAPNYSVSHPGAPASGCGYKCGRCGYPGPYEGKCPHCGSGTKTCQ